MKNKIWDWWSFHWPKIGIVALYIISTIVIISIILVGIMLCIDIDKNGLKPILERLWEGEKYIKK